MSFKANLPSTDWASVIRSGAIVVASTVVSFILQNIPATDFGSYGVIIIPVLSVLLDWLHRASTPTT